MRASKDKPNVPGLRVLETELPQLKQASTEQAEKLASKNAELKQRLEDEVQRLEKRLEVTFKSWKELES